MADSLTSCAQGRDRHLDWDGCYNTRDLGGLTTRHGIRTASHRVVRSDHVDKLTPAGWHDLWDYGVRTVIDLRNKEESPPPLPASLPTRDRLEWVHVPMSDQIVPTDSNSDDVRGTALQLRCLLEQQPDACAEAVSAVAHAREGAVLVQCNIGRDRTGAISLVLQALCGVRRPDIVADYVCSGPRLAPLFAALGRQDPQTHAARIHRRHGGGPGAVIAGLLDDCDIAQALLAAGLHRANLDGVRQRLLGTVR